MRAQREVLLAGGVINSPQVLMLSGIGDPDALRAAGIKPQVALRGVGQNLQDHVTVDVAFARKRPGPFTGPMRLDRIAMALADSLSARRHQRRERHSRRHGASPRYAAGERCRTCSCCFAWRAADGACRISGRSGSPTTTVSAAAP